MTDVLRVSAGVMVAGALLIGTFLPARTEAAAQRATSLAPQQAESTSISAIR
jgi:hypothetical protein